MDVRAVPRRVAGCSPIPTEGKSPRPNQIGSQYDRAQKENLALLYRSVPSFRPKPPSITQVCNLVHANTVHDLYINKPPPRAWSRMTGVGNSLKL